MEIHLSPPLARRILVKFKLVHKEKRLRLQDGVRSPPKYFSLR